MAFRPEQITFFLSFRVKRGISCLLSADLGAPARLTFDLKAHTGSKTGGDSGASMGRLQPPEPYHHSTHFLITFRHLAW